MISKEEVKTQDELVNILLQHHIDVTQATVSRDIKTLALVKIPAESGGYRYDMPQKNSHKANQLSQQDLVYRSITDIKIKDDLLALTARPGTTSLIKSHLLEQFRSSLFTVIIDDDRVLAVFQDGVSAKQAYQILKY
ncbi:transcription regulator [Lactococcus fujiensis JCM 16395]|uniref:Arginine repressor n=1 Tax=Lactococcus fujiensis JCM 16395 TaxID=1291764 RepID=A0A2A5RIQ9_9LACT|nr:transcription regulator [Lactococcus fujiensis JCM 16395]